MKNLMRMLCVISLILPGGCHQPNLPPSIISINVSHSNPRHNETIEITADAADPDGDALEYEWSCTVGSLSGQTGISVSWTAPAAGEQAAISLTVTDGRPDSFDSDTVNLILQEITAQEEFICTVQAGTGGKIRRPESGKSVVKRGISIPIAAEALPGYEFDSWSVVSGRGVVITDPSKIETAITLFDGDVTVQADFTPIPYTLTLTSTSGGHIIEPATSPVSFTTGTSIPLKAQADSGYIFTGWSVVSGQGVVLATLTESSTTITLSEGDVTIQANFTLTYCNLTLIATSGGHIIIPATSPASVLSLTPINLIAQADQGYMFTGWTVVSGQGAVIATPAEISTTITLNGGDAVIQASFIITYTLNLTSTSGGSIIAPETNPVSIPTGKKIPLSAWTNPGYLFNGWTVVSGQGAVIDTPGSISTMISLNDGNVTVQANFTLIPYTLTLTSTSGGHITTPAAGSVPFTIANNVNTLRAQADPGYMFNRWNVTSGSGTSFSAPRGTTTTVTLPAGNVSIEARFVHDGWTEFMPATESSGSYSAASYDYLNKTAKLTTATSAQIDFQTASVEDINDEYKVEFEMQATSAANCVFNLPWCAVNATTSWTSHSFVWSNDGENSTNDCQIAVNGGGTIELRNLRFYFRRQQGAIFYHFTEVVPDDYPSNSSYAGYSSTSRTACIEMPTELYIDFKLTGGDVYLVIFQGRRSGSKGTAAFIYPGGSYPLPDTWSDLQRVVWSDGQAGPTGPDTCRWYSIGESGDLQCLQFFRGVIQD